MTELAGISFLFILFFEVSTGNKEGMSRKLSNIWMDLANTPLSAFGQSDRRY